MLNLQLTVPKDFDPLIELPMAFLQKCAEQAPDAGDFRFRAMEICEELRAEHPDAAYVFHLSGMVAFINPNRESGHFFWAHALALDPTYAISRDALEAVVAEDDFWPGVDDYIEAAHRGRDSLIETYVSTAHRRFAEGDLDGADALCQRASALKRVNVSQLNPISICRSEALAMQTEGTLALRYAAVMDKYRRHWNQIDAASFDQMHAGWRELPDRGQLAQLTAGVAGDSRHAPFNILEIGCLTGFNHVLAREQMDDDTAGRARFYGLEPNVGAVAYGRKHFPWITFMEGTAEDMYAGVLELPESVDLCVVSRVFMILHPREVAASLTFMSQHVERFVICDDIMNLDGDVAAICTPGDFEIMHPFRKILAGVGFEVERVELARVPDRECSGFIVARRKGIEPA